jgi:hypothetical protein
MEQKRLHDVGPLLLQQFGQLPHAAKILRPMRQAQKVHRHAGRFELFHQLLAPGSRPRTERINHRLKSRAVHTSRQID